MTTEGAAKAAPFVIVGIAGGIAAYKSAEVVRGLKESGVDVQVVATLSALEFIGAPTLEALSGNPVLSDMWTNVHEVPHVRLGKSADLVVVAPATADLLARTVAGRSDDLLAATILTATAPVILAPAMHTEMWQNPATQSNVEVLRSRGMLVLEPAVGRLTGSDTGKGRLVDPAEIIAMAVRVLARGISGLGPDLVGKHVLISAGGTREPIDPVRWIGNRSSGKQGYALATEALARGAQVTVVSANVSLPDPAGAQVIKVETAQALQAAMVGRAAAADVIVMTAAVADHRPASVAEHKLKKSAITTDVETTHIELVQNPDILAGLVHDRELDHSRRGQVIVGFAAETGDDSADVLTHGKAKLAAKGVDLLVVNDVSGGKVFGRDRTRATILTRAGAAHEVQGTKDTLAQAVWDVVVRGLAD